MFLFKKEILKLEIANMLKAKIIVKLRVNLCIRFQDFFFSFKYSNIFILLKLHKIYIQKE